jgi:hypothetical protein
MHNKRRYIDIIYIYIYNINIVLFIYIYVCIYDCKHQYANSKLYHISNSDLS